MESDAKEEEKNKEDTDKTPEKKKPNKLAEKFLEVVKELKYPLLIAFAVMSTQIFTISQFRQFPGPLYGGDIYWHYGETLDIYNGNPPWANHQVPGEFAYYGWLTQFLIAWTSKITGISLEAVYLYFPAVLMLFLCLSAYYLGKEIFGEKNNAIIFTLLLASIGYTVTNIWRILGDLVLMMMFLTFLIRAAKTGKLKYSVLSGLSMGLAGLTHVIAFPAIASFMFFYFVYESFLGNFRISFDFKESKLAVSTRESKTSLKKKLFIFIPILIIGFLISLLFFGPIIFVYKGDAKNPLHEYTEPDMTKYGVSSLIESLSITFFNTSNPAAFIISVMALIGFYFAVKKRQEIPARIIFVLIFSAFITGFHYFITLPIFGRAIIPMYFFGFLTKIAVPLLFVYALVELIKFIEDFGHRKLIKYAIAVFLVVNLASIAMATYNDQWVSYGRTDRAQVYKEIQSWIIENTNDSDIFLSHEELSFAVNGLTARKVMISRRTHFSPYLDIDKRIADADVILYGNNSQLTSQLIKEYGVTYLYWDVNWLDFAKRESSLTSPKYEKYLSDNGVYFQKGLAYLDPAWYENQPKYEVLAVFPRSEDPYKPWSDTLDSHLELVKTFYMQGQEYAKIYKIKY